VVEETDVSEREQILGRVREALRQPSRKPHVHGVPRVPTAGGDRTIADVLPVAATDFASRVEQFLRNAEELKSDFRVVGSAVELTHNLRLLAEAEGWQKIAAHRGASVEWVVPRLGLPVMWTDPGFDARELEACGVGISECDALVAQTGSVVVTSRSAGGRALSVLPPHHVVLAREEQLVGSLPDALALLREKYAGDFPSMISFITGPSRTGDIERILVLGAHGPRKLTVILHP
jgi:L-lactate dehydrogenase complex protein LldG